MPGIDSLYPLRSEGDLNPLNKERFGHSIFFPLTAIIDSDPAGVALHAITIANFWEKPVWFAYNKSIFKLEIINGIPSFTCEVINSNFLLDVARYLTEFQCASLPKKIRRQ